MSRAVVESHIDDTTFSYGTHKRGAASSSLVDPRKDFKSCGVSAGMLLKNVTDGSSATVTTVTEDSVAGTLSGGTNNYWSVGDEYEIYLTGTEDSSISHIWTDRSRGWKVTCEEELTDGWFPEDIDLDEDEDEVWGPGQPSRSHR